MDSLVTTELITNIENNRSFGILKNEQLEYVGISIYLFALINAMDQPSYDLSYFKIHK